MLVDKLVRVSPPRTAEPIELMTFDLDGTIVESAAEIAAAANASLERLRLPTRDLATITAHIGHGGQALMASLLGTAHATRLGEAMQVFDAELAALAGRLARAYPGCRDALVALRSRGLRLACVTNKEALPAERMLRATGLHGCFDLIVGGDSLPHKKPHPSVLRSVAARFDIKLMGRVVHVGDSSIDVAAARAAGARAWAVPWGYNGGYPITDAAPDLVLASFDDLLLHVAVVTTQGAHPRRPR